ncbi:hypothetical protein PtA15_14A118 [Puccinia triticina]|uniref:Uncharacterized protein n=1 Tax=Puccinia triticina TaxID=208348 RepID=A0ABY7D0Y9_9BASI|nr:uncharacterized protein PtA15_14A118 [Puccinia triticina]WAQ91236.1 hypothetical protein PtA15_14A118 [Puccinia triticina]WAR62038.1 hypothetical protein PtB15_14B132 [Puccinia triticina]
MNKQRKMKDTEFLAHRRSAPIFSLALLRAPTNRPPRQLKTLQECRTNLTTLIGWQLSAFLFLPKFRKAYALKGPARARSIELGHPPYVALSNSAGTRKASSDPLYVIDTAQENRDHMHHRRNQP